MRRAMILATLATVIVSMAIGCGRRQAAPVSPTAAAPGASDAAADGTTLKASAPTLQSRLTACRPRRSSR